MGKVDVWKRTPMGYELHQELHPSPDITIAGTHNLLFGYRLAASEEFLAVRSLGGTPGVFATTGLVHIYQLVDDQWLEADIVRPVLDATAFGTGFGESLTIQGHELVVGAILYSGATHAGVMRGGVHIYDLSVDGRASLQQTIEAPNITQRQFGESSDLHGDVMVVGQPGVGGSAQVYRRLGATWQLVQTLLRPGGPNTSYDFGLEVAIDHIDGSIFVSDTDLSPGEKDGTLYRFARSFASPPYLLAESFTATEGTLVSGLGDYFAESFEVSGDVLAIGSQTQAVQGVRKGTCELYRRGTNGWDFAGRLAFPHLPGQPFPVFGNEVAVDDGRVLVADMSWGDGTGTTFGRCYIWEVSSAVEICSSPGDESHINVCRQASTPNTVDVTASGLDFDGIIGLAVGAVDVVPGVTSGLCIQQFRRLTSPMAVTAGQSTAIFTDLAMEPNVGPGFAVQAFYLRSNMAPRLAIGPAVELFE